MAVIKRQRGEEAKPKRKVEKRSDVVMNSLTLPDLDEPDEEVTLSDIVILIHGERKIGKTTLASRFPECFVMATEVGYKGLHKLRKRPVNNWTEARGYYRLLRKDRQYQTVCIDTADKLYQICEDQTLGDLGIEDLSDEDWGKGWRRNRKAFDALLTGLASLPKGLILISHTDVQKFERRNGASHDRLEPTMPKQAREIVAAMADIIAYYQYDGSRRILTILGDDSVVAGHRFEDRFCTPDGQRIRHIDMGRSPDEGYSNFVKAFNNKYTPANPDDLWTPEEEDEDERPRKKKLTLKRRPRR